MIGYRTLSCLDSAKLHEIRYGRYRVSVTGRYRVSVMGRYRVLVTGRYRVSVTGRYRVSVTGLSIRSILL
jgi:hypothetical protein